MRLLASKSVAVKVLASAALVGGAASVAGLGTFGAFTSTTSASHSVATGKLTLGNTSGANGLSVAATGMVPGDNIQRSITLTRAADSETFGTVKLTTAGTTTNLLTSDVTNGLQVAIDQCSAAWVKVGNDLQCQSPAVQTSVFSARPVVQSLLALPQATVDNLNATGAAANLRVTLTLPTNADNAFQNLSNTINFTFDATQRANKSL